MLGFLHCEAKKVKMVKMEKNLSLMFENLKRVGKNNSSMTKMTRIEKRLTKILSYCIPFVSEKRKQFVFVKLWTNESIMRANGSKQ